MCGITGYVGFGDREILEKMNKTLIHRGPDDQGFFIEDKIGLAHRRLSIIDLKTGYQPMTNEDRTIWLVFNGEIYNFVELRKDLEKKGHQFKTESDTETLIHLYEEKGEDFLKEFNGMFALALWDKQKRKLILARDRLGQKPLYYSLINNNLVFGSELKAIFEYPLIKKEIDFDSLNKYLIYEYVPHPQTILRGVRKLEPGHILIYQNKQVKKYPYWQIEFNQLKEPKNYFNKFEYLLEDAVKKRLISDVPLGVLLSGGIDSSTISYFAQKNSLKKIKTFSIGFTDKSFDESVYAHQIARFLKTEHYHQNCVPNDLLDLVDDIAEINDEPLADASIIPTYLLSKFTRQKVTVALGGDGGDELMAGYPTLQAAKFAKMFRVLPRVARKTIQKIVSYWPVSFDNFSLDFRIKKLLSGYDYSPEIQNQIWLGSFTPLQNQQLFLPDIANQIDFSQSFSELNQFVEQVKGQSSGHRLIYLYLKQYLADDILVKADRASMFTSLEVRAPFLDYRLVEFINSLPYHLKLKGWTTKYLLKQAIKDKLPANIINRPKKGFGIPVAKWIRNELKDFTLELLEESKIKEQGIFNYSYIKQLLNEHFSGHRDNRKLIWTLMIFQMWQEKWNK